MHFQGDDMSKHKIFFATGALAVFMLGGAGGAVAQNACTRACASLPDVRYDSPEKIPPVIAEVLQQSEFLEVAIMSGLSFLRNSGEDRRLLTRDVVEKARAREMMDHRRQALRDIVKYDEDMDGFVTPAEIDALLSLEQRNGYVSERNDRRRQEVMQADADGDGRVSLREAATYNNTRRGINYSSAQSDKLESFLALDTDGDGALSIKEMEAVIRAAFAVLDKDEDGVLDAQEKKSLQDLLRRQREVQQMKALATRCAMPKAAADEDVAYLGTQEGSAISAASFSAERRQTFAAEISVSTLEKKKYLVLAAAMPMIWDITGPVTHISRVVVFGPGEAGQVQAGVRGIAKDRITFLSMECMPKFYEDVRNRQGENPGAVTAIEAYLGQPPRVAQSIDMLYKATLLGGEFITVSKPSDTEFEKPKAGFDPDIWREKIAREKRALHNIPPEDVVSGATLVLPGVLPGSYGLAKLVHDGVIEKVPSGRFMRVYETGNGNSVRVIDGNNTDTDTVIVQGGGTASERRVPIYEYRLRRDIPSLNARLVGIRKLYVPDNVKIPPDLGLRECSGQTGPAGERVFNVNCSGE